MEEESKTIRLMKLKRQLASVCEMEKNNEKRKEKIRTSLVENEEKMAEIQSRVDKLKLIKENYKDYVLKIWPNLRESIRTRPLILDSTSRLDAGGVQEQKIEVIMPRKKKPKEREANLSTFHQQVVSLEPKKEENVVRIKEKAEEVGKIELQYEKKTEIDAYEKFVRNSERKTSSSQSSEDGTDVEKQMAAFVSSPKPRELDENKSTVRPESSSDESSEKEKSEKTEIKPNLNETRKKLAALHLGLDSDSDDVTPSVLQNKNKNDEKDDDFTFFD